MVLQNIVFLSRRVKNPPESELADESFNIVINDLKPRETYRVEMFLSDYYCINAPMRLAHDVLWKSTATFVSDRYEWYY